MLASTVGTTCIGQFLDAGLFEIDGFTLGGTQPAVAQLTGGNVMLATVSDGQIFYSIFTATGGNAFAGAFIEDTNSSAPQVAALRNGGFVIVSTDTFSATDRDIDVRFFNAAGA